MEPIVLALLRERDPYGYELGERLRELGFEVINPGTLYRTLRRMEWHGLCESEWETSERGRVRGGTLFPKPGRRTSNCGPKRWSNISLQ